jgi:ferric-dicitrate binding protein FerR (iron transport regulator)
MERKEFYEILNRYRSGQASQEEIKLIDAWYEAMGQQPDKVLSAEQEERLADRFWNSLEAQLGKPKKHRSIILWTSIGVAASVALAVFAFVFWLNNGENSAEKFVAAEGAVAGEWQQISNSKKTHERIVLPDSSTIILAPNSVIRLSPFFNKSERKILLEGEASFDVTHDQQKPFIVFANEITTKVLGTRFTVRSFKHDKDVIVAVESGKVSVLANRGIDLTRTDEYILTPNQEIVYDKHEEKISRRIVESPQPILPPEEVKRMRFVQAPADEIFLAIEKIYGVDIEFDEQLFSSCTVTTSISDGDLYNRLNIITSAIGAKYTIDGNKILIAGSGCN